MNGSNAHVQLGISLNLKLPTSNTQPFTHTHTKGLGFISSIKKYLTKGGLVLLTLLYLNCFVMPAKPALTLPTANPDAVTACGPTTVVIDVLANDLPGTTPIQRIYQIFDSSGNAGTLAVSPDSLSVIYTVAFAFSGTDLFTYQVQDQSGIVSAPATLTVTGSCGSGGAITANDDCAETAPGIPVTVSVLQNDFTESNTLSIASATVLSGGGAANLSINADETLTYTPPAGFTGLAQIQYTASNGTATDVATLSIYITSGVNSPPVFPDVYLCSNPIQPVVICLSETDSDGDPITITQVNSLFDCGITIQNNHCIQYVALPAFFGVDTLTLTVCDQHYGNPCNPEGTPGSLCATVKVIVTVPCPNAQNDVVFTPVNTPIVVNVTANDIGVPTLTVQIITPPANGTATITDNNVAYTPNTGFIGTDTIIYQITDPNGNTDTALVIVHVVPNTELPPIAVDDLIACPFSVEPNGTISPVSLLLNVLSNDTDPNGNLAGIVAVGTPLYGTATIVLGGNNILYAPSSAYLLGSVTEQFFYVVSDAAGLTDTAFVTITCNLTQTAPCIVAVNDAQVLPSGSAITINVLANDLYCANCTSATVSTCQPLSIIPPITSISISNTPTNGSVTVVNNGAEDVAITYTPNPGYSGPDVLQYTVCLPDGTCGTATVNITVIPPATEQSITANNDFATTTAGTPVVIQVLNNDQLCLPPLPCLPPLNTGQILSITILSPPANGVATVNTFLGSSISVTYTPNNGFTGANTFQYIVCSVAQSLCDTATVTVSVAGSGGNNPPVANNDFVATAINSPLPIFALANDFDPNGDPITITAIAVQPQNGTAFINPDGNITYTPNFNFVGVDTLTYVISDSSLTDDALVIIFVEGAPINQPPVANNDFATTPLNTPVTIPVLDNDTDPNGDSISIVGIDTQPASGFVFINPGGTITYNPNPGFTGIDSFAYQITDGQLTDIAWVFVTVTEQANQPPVATTDFVATPPGAPINIAVLDNDFDPEGQTISIVTVATQPNNGTANANPDGTVTYIPNPGFLGVDTFTYQITDGALTAIGTVIIFVEGAPINQPPVANNDFATTPLNTPVTIPVLDNDTDPNGDNISIVGIDTQPANGFVFINPGGTITYNPNPGFTGIDSFAYQITDGQLTDIAWVFVTVTEQTNQPPVATTDFVATPPDTPINIAVLDNDFDPEGQTISIVTVATQPNNGTANANPDGTVTYIPNPGFLGVDTFTYQITDGALTAIGTVIIFVEGSPLNQPPVANNDFATTPLNTPVTIPVLDNDTDPNGDSISIVGIDTQPANGFVFINPGGTITYNPNPGFTGIDSFAYQITDGQLTDIAWVVVSVQEDVNEAPIANDDNASTTPDTPVTIPVLDNDTDPDGDVLTVVDIPTPPANGTATINPDSTITYTPNPGFIGTDTFTYVISDGEFTDTAQVIVSVEEDVNEAPIANDDNASTTPDTPVTIPVLDNDTDPDGDALTVVDIPTPPANGTATINPDSTITYTPNPGFIGTDTFTYVISDGEFTDTAQVVVSVQEDVNEAPIANDDNASTTPDTPVTIPVLDNDTDPDGDALTVVDIPTPPANGTATINPDSTITYTPNPGFIGTDTFTYVISDGEFTDTAQVIVSVEEDVNEAPIANDDNASTTPDTPVTIPVLDNDTDPDGDALTVVDIPTPPANGTATINPDSTITYTPNPGFIGTDTFTYVISDGEFTDTAQVIVSVEPLPNEPPVAVDDTDTTEVNTPVTIPVLDNDTDPDGDALTVVDIPTPPANGTAMIETDGTITYMPDLNFEGTDTFTYVITDGEFTDTAQVIVTVGNPDNLPPIAVDDAVSTPFETAVVITVLTNDSDPNGDTLTVIDLPVLPFNGTAVINPDGTVNYTPNAGFIGTDTFVYVITDGTQTDTAQVTVTILPPDCNPDELFIPNGFSPNGDNINDLFLINNIDICFPENEIVIFNRWGDEVYRQKGYNQSNAWNGDYQSSGKRVPDGTYFYVLLLNNEGKDRINGYLEVCR